MSSVRLELVVGLQLLLDVERRRELVGVEQADLGDLLGLAQQRRTGRACLPRHAVLLGGDLLVEAEGGRRGGLVALDRGAVEARRARLLAVAVDQRGPDAADQQGRHGHRGEAGHQPAQAPEPHVREQRQSAPDRHDHEDRPAGQHGVGVGVGQTGHRAAARRGEAEAREPVRRALEQEVEAEQQRHLRLEPGCHPASAPADAQRAVQVGRDQGDDQAGDHDGAEVVDHHLVERQYEDEVGEVAMELRVGLVPGLGVAPQQVGLPAVGGAGADADPEIQGDDRDDPVAQV